MYAHGGACRPDEDRADTGAYCPTRSMVREPYDGIIGDAPIGAIPLGRVAQSAAPSSDTPTRQW